MTRRGVPERVDGYLARLANRLADDADYMANVLRAYQAQERMDAIAREAQAHNEEPAARWFKPSGDGVRPMALVTSSNKNVQITTIKQAEDGQGWIIRLFEPTGRKQKTQLRIKAGKSMRKNLTMKSFEIKTLKVGPDPGTILEADLVEGQS